MTRVLTTLLLLCVLMTSGAAGTSREVPDADLAAEAQQQAIADCRENLEAIARAVETYEKQHNALPEWLSDLYPKYLQDTEVFICPADAANADSVFSSNTDPKMPMSYDYEFQPKYRRLKNEQRLVYGDAMPLVRCQHHEKDTSEILNLSLDAKIYWSPRLWQYAPEAIYGSHAAAISAFQSTLEKHPHDKRFSQLYSLLVRLYVQVETLDAAEALLEKFQRTMPVNIASYITLTDMLEVMGRYEQMLEVLAEAEQEAPNDSGILRRLARTHQQLGNHQIAKEYERKADPAYQWIGKRLADFDFSATDLQGKTTSLQQYRGKVVLLDFWAVWCVPCVAEMPTLKKVYDTYKHQGFDIIGINLDTDENKLRKFLKDNDILWRQVYIADEYPNPIALQYGIRTIPSLWLIDTEGKLITHKARAEDLEKRVAAALRRKNAESMVPTR